MKLLTRVQLINWHYFSNEIIRFGKIDFLTGANSAGKSTIIDALQAAIMGETRSSRFNRAAGKKSERTFRSYLVGTLGEDVSSGVKALREGKDFSSYVVAEFYDDIKGEYFCIGVVADVYHDGSDERKRWFILEDKLPSQQFIKDGKSTDSTEFLKWGRQNYAENKFQSFDSVEGYNRNVLRRMNVFDPKVFTMIRKAIAFEPISNIEEFITTNICDIEKNINTLDMQENIKSYQLTERQAKDMEQRQSTLAEICEKYENIKTLRTRKMLRQFYIDYGYYRNEQKKLEEANTKVGELTKIVSECGAELERLSAEMSTLKAESDMLNSEKAQFLNDTGKIYLEQEKEYTKEKIDKCRNDENKLINNVRVNTEKWIGKCDVIQSEMSEEQAISAIENLRCSLKRISHFSEQSFGDTSLKYFSEVKEAYEKAIFAARPIAEHYSDDKHKKSRQISILNDEIATLNSGRKPYPINAVKLKNAIQEELTKQYGRDITVDFLADLIDVSNNEWKNAVEGILGDSRMNIIVAPKYFMDAYYIYKRIYKTLNVHEYSVVDLERVFADQQIVKANSLAQVVSCKDKYVRKYIDYLLGRVICCYDDEKIRNHRTSVTRECMLYRGYAVKPINPRYYQNPYIGSRSIEEQLKQKTAELEICKSELTEIESHLRNANTFCDSEWFLNQTFLDNVAAPAFEANSLLPALTEKLCEISDKLSKIDTTRLEEIEGAIKENVKKQDGNSENRDDTLKRLTKASVEQENLNEVKIPALEQSISEKSEHISEKYDENFRKSKAIPEFEKRLPQYGSPIAFANAFISPVKQTETEISKAEQALIDKRGNYNSTYHPPFNFSDTNTNDDYEEEYKRIRDIELPAFAEKITRAKEMAMESFRDDFVNKLKNNIQAVLDQIKELNSALSKARFGNNTYKFECKPNPDYIEYYEMIMASQEGETLFSYDFREKYKDTIENLFSQLELADSSDSAAAEAVDKLSRYSTYLSFDLLSIDANGITEKLSRTITSKSGGEIQTPFYVAILASFAQLYKVNDMRNQTDNTMRLIIFDEAFNKMDPERISESIAMLRKFGLQTIICSPSDKAGDICPLCDKTLLVDKQPDGNGGYRSTVIEWTKEMGEIKCDTEEIS
ncbi:MAG TPA: hypothetical protein DDX91_05840 [Ruminococcaceae bacterium]|nr:hypothetical protein [Oscillospiraceae bacterium]